MNVSHEHRVIWLTKPEMGEKFVATALEPFNFETIDVKNNGRPTTKQHISFIDKIPSGCEDYSLILSMRNPYFQIINYYLKVSETNWVLKSQSREEFKESLNKWVSEIFSVDEEVLLQTDNNLQQIFPYKFQGKHIDFVIKYEKIQESLIELLFLMGKNLRTNQNLLKDNTEFEIDALTFENAQKIYKVFKKTFNDFNYDPFSFSSGEFSLKEKVDFIHN